MKFNENISYALRLIIPMIFLSHRSYANTKTYRISGMKCTSCLNIVKKSLISYDSEAVVTFDPPEVRFSASAPVSLPDINKELSLHGFSISSTNNRSSQYEKWKVYQPLIGALSLVFLLTAVRVKSFQFIAIVKELMGWFYIVFSMLKMYNIKSFAESFKKYDIIAKNVIGYNLLYPFLEFSLGLGYLVLESKSQSNRFIMRMVDFISLLIMSSTTLGIYESLHRQEEISCACMGSSVKIPLSTISFYESLTMALMALVHMFWKIR
jgi:copper chaperone CopZ